MGECNRLLELRVINVKIRDEISGSADGAIWSGRMADPSRMLT